MKIAILGATGHLAKCALWAWSQDMNNEFYLFSRKKDKLKTLIKDFSGLKYHLIEGYDMFASYKYDVIFNGTGFWDMPGCISAEVFTLTEEFDKIILEYQKLHPLTKAIHISSGAVYSGRYDLPVEENSQAVLEVNHIKVGDFYSIAKINSEAKHRAHSEFSIIDLRLFGFFSRFMDLEYHYLLSAIISCLKSKKVFTCVGDNFWRDYIHMDDFSNLLLGICKQEYINEAIDVRSTRPISRDDMIKLFVNEYGLSVKIEEDKDMISKTGTKPYYYSHRETSVYIPRFSSEEALREELRYFIQDKE